MQKRAPRPTPPRPRRISSVKIPPRRSSRARLFEETPVLRATAARRTNIFFLLLLEGRSQGGGAISGGLGDGLDLNIIIIVVLRAR